MKCVNCGEEFLFCTFVHPRFQSIIPLCNCTISRKMVNYSIDHGVLYIHIAKRRNIMDTYNLSPLGKLLKSRKFLLLVLDTVVSIVLFAVANYFPSADASAKFLVGSLQPVFVAIIIAISIEDSALTRSVNSK